MARKRIADWKGLKWAQRHIAAKRCEVCDSRKQVQRHHRDGDRSNNRAENVQVLCQRCHAAVHVAAGTWGWMARTRIDRCA